MSKKDEKTNVMRILDQKKIPYKSYNYLQTGAVNGMEVAQALGEDPGMVFKTLVCSPIGMKKQFATTIDRSVEEYGRIIFSAGKIGFQVEVSLEDLKKVIRYGLDDIAE